MAEPECDMPVSVETIVLYNVQNDILCLKEDESLTTLSMHTCQRDDELQNFRVITIWWITMAQRIIVCVVYDLN